MPMLNSAVTDILHKKTFKSRMATAIWVGPSSLVKERGSRQALDMLGIEQDPSWFKHDRLPYKIWFRVKGPRNQIQSP